MQRCRLRGAEAGDLGAILAIYNDVIANTTAVYTDRPSTLEERAAWLADRSARGLAVTVATDDDGRVIGYGSFGPFRPWPGYATTVEHSLYVAPEARGQGVGRLLLTALVDAAREGGYCVMIGGIDAGNAASLALHEKLGFVRAGRLHRVARKFGDWLDLVFVEKQLQTGPGNSSESSPRTSPAMP